MIPCIGCAIVNRSDLLARLMASVDFSVAEFRVINNGGIPLPLLDNPNIKSQQVVTPGGNLGCAGGWNALISHAFEHSDYSHILIVGNDIAFAPGDLEMYDRAFREHPEIDFINGNQAFSTYALSRTGHQKLGWYDENFRMAFCEDSDYWRRICLSGATTLSLPTNSIHGEAPHFQSTTIHSDPELYRVVKAQQELNWDYYIRKWGAKRHTGRSETFVHPFNDQNWPLNHWVLNEDRKQYPYFRANG